MVNQDCIHSKSSCHEAGTECGPSGSALGRTGSRSCGVARTVQKGHVYPRTDQRKNVYSPRLDNLNPQNILS